MTVLTQEHKKQIENYFNPKPIVKRLSEKLAVARNFESRTSLMWIRKQIKIFGITKKEKIALMLSNYYQTKINSSDIIRSELAGDVIRYHLADSSVLPLPIFAIKVYMS